MADKAAPLRIDLLLAKSYDPDPRVRRTAKALIEAGHDVRVVAWDRTGRRPIEEDDAGIPIRRIHVRSRASRGWTQAFFLFVVALRLLPVVRRRRPDVLHAVNLPMLAVALGLAPFVGRRPRIVYDAFEIHSLMGAHRYPDWLVTVIGNHRALPAADGGSGDHAGRGPTALFRAPPRAVHLDPELDRPAVVTA